jgi:tripartite-type tricarboxylate transporter receptor subunit TctC
MAIRGHDQAACCNTRRRLIASASLLLLCPAVARAVDYPARTVTIIVPFPPGGSTDLQGRLIASGLSERLGRPVIVENRAGAGGDVGSGIAARAAADGYTLLLAGSTLVIEQVLGSNLGFDPERDLAPVALIAEGPLILVASPPLGVKNVSELLTLARQHPGQLAYASFGSGSHSHLAGELLKASAGVDLLHVPYKGGAPALLAVMGGQVAAGIVTPLTAMESIRAGKVSALAVTGSRRLPSLPSVPTLAESGVSGIELEMWSAIFVPAKTPRKIIARLSKEIVAVVQSSEVTRTIEDQGAFVVASGPDEVSGRVHSDFASLSRQVKTINFKVVE